MMAESAEAVAVGVGSGARELRARLLAVLVWRCLGGLVDGIGSGPGGGGVRPGVGDGGDRDARSGSCFRTSKGSSFQCRRDRIRLFVIRWPTSLDRISPSALLEVTGLNRGSNMLVTQHIDVYEGARQADGGAWDLADFAQWRGEPAD